MPKKLPTRSAKTYSRKSHRAETEALIEEQLLDAESTATAIWIDPDPPAEERTTTASANASDASLATLMSTPTADPSATTPIYESGPTEITPQSSIPLATLLQEPGTPKSSPQEPGQVSMHLQGGASANTATSTAPPASPVTAVSTAKAEAATKREEDWLDRTIDRLVDSISRSVRSLFKS